MHILPKGFPWWQACDAHHFPGPRSHTAADGARDITFALHEGDFQVNQHIPVFVFRRRTKLSSSIVLLLFALVFQRLVTPMRNRHSGVSGGCSRRQMQETSR